MAFKVQPGPTIVGPINGGQLIPGSVSGPALAVGSVTANAIAANAVTANAIAANAITGKTITGGVINGTVINGTVFNGTTYIQNSNGIFLYSAAPALNNLVASIAPASGTDAYGNKYIAGVSTYVETGFPSFIQMVGNTLTFGQITSGTPDIADGANINASAGEMDLFSGKNPAPNNDQARLSLFAGQPNQGTGTTFNPFGWLLDTATSSEVDFMPSGSVLKISKTGNLYTWQFPGFASGYTAGAVAQYRRDSFDNVVWDLAFTQTTGVAGSGGAVITTAVPAEYRPKSARMVPCTWESSGSASKGSATLVFNTSGTISLLWPSSTASGDKFAAVVSIPLGNIQ